MDDGRTLDQARCPASGRNGSSTTSNSSTRVPHPDLDLCSRKDFPVDPGQFVVGLAVQSARIDIPRGMDFPRWHRGAGRNLEGPGIVPLGWCVRCQDLAQEARTRQAPALRPDLDRRSIPPSWSPVRVMDPAGHWRIRRLHGRSQKFSQSRRRTKPVLSDGAHGPGG